MKAWPTAPHSIRISLFPDRPKQDNKEIQIHLFFKPKRHIQQVRKWRKLIFQNFFCKLICLPNQPKNRAAPEGVTGVFIVKITARTDHNIDHLPSPEVDFSKLQVYANIIKFNCPSESIIHPMHKTIPLLAITLWKPYMCQLLFFWWNYICQLKHKRVSRRTKLMIVWCCFLPFKGVFVDQGLIMLSNISTELNFMHSPKPDSFSQEWNTRKVLFLSIFIQQHIILVKE